MNDTVKQRLEWLKNKTESIMKTCECLLDDIQEITEMDDLMLVETEFERIERQAKDGYDYARNTWDEFDNKE